MIFPRDCRVTITAKLLIVAALLGGCATQGAGRNYAPLVDRPGPNFSSDLFDCQQHAARLQDSGEGALGGAFAGAALGAAFMAILGGNAGEGAAFGALSGAGSGAVAAETAQRNVIAKCLEGRGHRVLQ